MDTDTDTLLAVVHSLLTVPPPADTVVLAALADADGDPARAAARLNAPRKKRKRAGSTIDSWLGKSPPAKAPRQTRVVSSPSPSTSTRAAAPATPVDAPAPVPLALVLRPPPSAPPPTPRLPPLTLGTPELVAQHTTCTLHHSILPPALAHELFDALTSAAQAWPRNKFWLFDRLVESPHRTNFFVRDETAAAGPYWYNGREMERPTPFPPALAAAVPYVERAVNAALAARTRLPLEFAGPWQANVAAANCYTGAREAVGWHTDVMTYLGPHCTIASLSLGTTRVFALRAAAGAARTLNVPLAHNSLAVMHAGTQEGFKHAVPPQRALDLWRGSNCRINVTFRFYRPDYAPATTPVCKCGVPAVLRADFASAGDARRQRYWWACTAGYQGEDKPNEGCGMWRVMDPVAEGRGPFIRDVGKGEGKSADVVPTTNSAGTKE